MRMIAKNQKIKKQNWSVNDAIYNKINKTCWSY